MVRQLRDGRGQNGLVLANGGLLSHHHTVCLSRHPRNDSLPYSTQPCPSSYVGDEHPPIVKRAEGPAVIEVLDPPSISIPAKSGPNQYSLQTYTVQYNRDGSPQAGFILGRMRNGGGRFIANAGDAATLKDLTSKVNEQIGRQGWVSHDKKTERNSFVYQRGSNL
jgi:hypothetical protein